jgi:hypothetical protein
MADGMFGVGFTSIDGHHLELDNEFAFSMRETQEEWEEQQMEWGEFDVEMDEIQEEAEESDTDDPFASVWSGVRDDVPLPGDRSGHLKMAFMVSEIISALQFKNADHSEIKTLNEAFTDYRRSDDTSIEQSAIKLKKVLQSLGDQYPELISKSADLQSRIDEATRVASLDDSNSDTQF